ncbi:MAG: helix-turn-helix transcriptional regulator [Clostridia bacterium]|nr:helix-turn-helix transcriptional regulator [Clostridia bacterium]
MHESDLINIGKRIQQRRKQLALTQEQVAEMMNVSVQMISNLERGNKAIRIDNLVNLSNILNISTDYILTGKETITDLSALTERIQSLTEKEQQMIELLIDFCSKDND